MEKNLDSGCGWGDEGGGSISDGLIVGVSEAIWGFVGVTGVSRMV